MYLRYNIDPETGEPHIYKRGVCESDVEHVLRDRRMSKSEGDGVRSLIGQAPGGRYLKVIYRAEGRDNFFIITAYFPNNKDQQAHRRRKRRKPG